MAFAKSRQRRRLKIFTVICVVLAVSGFMWRITDSIINASWNTAASPSPSSVNAGGEAEGTVDGAEVEDALGASGSCESFMGPREYEDFNARLLEFGEIRMMADGAQKTEQIRKYVTQDYFDFYVPPTTDNESDLSVRNVFDPAATQTECSMGSSAATTLTTTMVPAVTTYGTVDGVEEVLEEPSTDITYTFVWVKLDGFWYVNQEN